MTNVSLSHLFYEKKLAGDIPSFKLIGKNKATGLETEFNQGKSKDAVVFDSLDDAKAKCLKLNKKDSVSKWTPFALTNNELLKLYS